MADTGAAESSTDVVLLGMGGTIDKDYPKVTNGYAFEIDEPAATRILAGLPNLGISFRVDSICQKDSTEIDDDDRIKLVSIISAEDSGQRIVVTHGTDTLIETARFLFKSGLAADKRVAFTGAMKPDKFKDSDAGFNVGGAIASTSIIPRGSVVICMGGNAVHCKDCIRCLETGLFLDSTCGHSKCESVSNSLQAKEETWEWLVDGNEAI